MILSDRPIYVIDTNIIIDYVEIIPNGQKVRLQEPTVDLGNAHLVIPTAVIRECSKFKNEKSERGKNTREAQRRLRVATEGKVATMDAVYNLNAPVQVKNGDQIISILPVHKNFKDCLPFKPSDEDMDGQIILATLTVMMIQNGLPIDGTAQKEDVLNLESSNVTLLTNDNGLAIRARERGIKTSRFGYKYPEPYTGRRDLVVPKEMFECFFNERRVLKEDFERWLPDERPLVANEFIIMKLEDYNDYPRDFDPVNNPYFLHIGRYDRDERAIIPLQYISGFPIRVYNAGQAIYAEALMNPDFAAVICTGSAGSGKTYMSAIYGYEACRNGEFIGITVVPCKNQSGIGALPGELNDKMSLDIQIIKNALRNYLLKEDQKFKKRIDNLKKFGATNKSKRNADDEEGGPSNKSIKVDLEDRVDLIWDNWFSCMPVENARGRDFSYELALYDEFQDQSVALADTLIKRIGSEGKIVIAGDLEQQRAPYLDLTNNGLVYVTQLLYDSSLVARVNFTEDEIVRHPLVKLIAERQKVTKLPSGGEE